MAGRLWSRDEDRRIKKLYRIVPIKDLAAQLGRTWVAVSIRAGLLRVRRPTRRWQVFKVPSALVRSYTAGLVDGEGSIQINPSRSGKKRYWCLTVQVSSSAEGFLESVRAAWDEVGTVTYWHAKGSRKNRRSCNWRIYAFQSVKFLRSIRPFLRLKQEQASIALEFAECRVYKKGALTPELQERRRALALRMKALNAKTSKTVSRSFVEAL